MSGWYYFEDGFSVEEIDSILEMADQFPFVAGKISADDGSIDGSEYRISNIKWLSATDSANNAMRRTHWVYDRLMEMIDTANNAMWGFHLHGLTDSIQYTEYDGSEEGFYDWHVDIGPDELALRKLSLVVQLSDPSEYEGDTFKSRQEVRVFSYQKERNRCSISVLPLAQSNASNLWYS